mmetsp:Transcript_129598/g.361117  ORF Transcript_129598/g.361117 Transcript_129598/m.361117 type:complete len:225 (-) Transcript_129598:135-809(-)
MPFTEAFFRAASRPMMQRAPCKRLAAASCFTSSSTSSTPWAVASGACLPGSRCLPSARCVSSFFLCRFGGFFCFSFPSFSARRVRFSLLPAACFCTAALPGEMAPALLGDTPLPSGRPAVLGVAATPKPDLRLGVNLSTSPVSSGGPAWRWSQKRCRYFTAELRWLWRLMFLADTLVSSRYSGVTMLGTLLPSSSKRTTSCRVVCLTKLSVLSWDCSHCWSSRI